MELNCDLGLRAYTGDEWKGKGRKGMEGRGEFGREEKKDRRGEKLNACASFQHSATLEPGNSSSLARL